MNLPRLTHPGPVRGPRIELVPCAAQPVSLRLRAGLTVAQAVTEALAEAGFAAGYLRLDGLSLAPLSWVIPAPAPGDGRVAWFSAPRSLDAARIDAGGLHLGQSDGQPFCHCHGRWTGAAGEPGAGHLLCEESVLAADAVVSGWGLRGAVFRREDDPETGFALFRPVQDREPGGQGAYLCRIRPNEDPVSALAALGLGPARVEGLGSLVGAAFQEGDGLSEAAVEIFVEHGRLSREGALLRIAATGMSGRLHRGTLSAGRNAVCVTAELLLLPERS